MYSNSIFCALKTKLFWSSWLFKRCGGTWNKYYLVVTFGYQNLDIKDTQNSKRVIILNMFCKSLISTSGTMSESYETIQIIYIVVGCCSGQLMFCLLQFQMFFFLILVFLTMEFQSFLNLEDSVSLFSSACCKVLKSYYLFRPKFIDWDVVYLTFSYFSHKGLKNFIHMTSMSCWSFNEGTMEFFS